MAERRKTDEGSAGKEADGKNDGIKSEPRRSIRLLEYARRNYWWYVLITLAIIFINESFLESIREITIITFLAIFFLIFFGAAGMVRRAWILLHQTPVFRIGTLVWAYMLGAFGLIVLFGMLYSVVDVTRTGALSYAHCGPSLAETLKYPVVHNGLDTVYFSAITFFTVGYGDICPMGTAKAVAVLNTMSGALFTSVVIGIGIAFFLESRKQMK